MVENVSYIGYTSLLPKCLPLNVSQINSLASLQLPISFSCSETMSGSWRPVPSNISCYMVLLASLSLASSWHPTAFPASCLQERLDAGRRHSLPLVFSSLSCRSIFRALIHTGYRNSGRPAKEAFCKHSLQFCAFFFKIP